MAEYTNRVTPQGHGMPLPALPRILSPRTTGYRSEMVESSWIRETRDNVRPHLSHLDDSVHSCCPAADRSGHIEKRCTD